MNALEFSSALLNPDAALPQGLLDPQGRPAAQRFNVYRNNVTTSLIRALEAGFPAILSLVGADFFGAMAMQFTRAHPPKSRVMMLYGGDFADFIQGFGPAVSLGYLPDMARLEQALRGSYHAGDCAPLDANLLAGLNEADLRAARVTLAPALRLQASDWPIFGIWNAALHGGAPPEMSAQAVIILRPEFDPAPHLLPPAAYPFLRDLAARRTIGAALDAAATDFDLAATLSLLIAGGGLAGIDWNDA